MRTRSVFHRRGESSWKSKHSGRRRRPLSHLRRLTLESLEDRRLLSVDPFPLPLSAKEPLGGLIYDSAASGVLAAPGEVDGFTIDLDHDQTVTVVVDPEATLHPAVDLLDPGSVSIGGATAGAAGEDAVLQVVPTTEAGKYTVSITGASGSSGGYTVQLVLNAAVEDEEHDGPANDRPASAEDLDASFIAPGGTLVRRGAVLGTVAPSEDWHRFTLGDDEAATLTLTALTPGDVALDLYDGGQTRMAAGVAAANAGQVIDGFVDRTTDGGPNEYYARVSGDAGTDYSLTVTRNADLETRPPDRVPPDPQEITLRGAALGHIGQDSTWSQRQKLTTVDTSFGQSVSVDGDTAIMGAPSGDGGAPYSGSAYIFQFDGIQWHQQQKLTASDAAGGDSFGRSVAIHGDTAIVGADDDDNPIGRGSGSAYVFRYDGSRWQQEQKLTASDADERGRFGCSVSISGETAIVGASSHSAYIFQFDGSGWHEQQRLTPSDPEGGQWFGPSVSISGDMAIVGAERGEYDSAYVFRYDGSQWHEQQRLIPSHAAAGTRFGRCVSISGDRAIIGDPDRFGSAYVFRYDGSQWYEQQKLTASDEQRYDRFGASVSISGDMAIVGAFSDDDVSGSAYVFRFDGSRWQQKKKLTASDVQRFGWGVAISGDTAFVGTARDPDEAPWPGGVYVFRLSAADDYAVGVRAGDELAISTLTPADGPAEFVNRLDPAIELYAPDRTLVAHDDNGAADGRNASLLHTATASGTYVARVRGVTDTKGEYVLSVDGHTGALPEFEVIATDPADGVLLSSVPGQMTVDFNDSVLLGALEASDLTVDGSPAVAVTVVDGDTLAFELPAGLSDGTHQVAIAGGVIRDLSGTPIEAFACQFALDLSGPRVTASSVLSGDVLPLGTLTYTARFDEELDASNLDPSDVLLGVTELVGSVSAAHAPATFGYDPAGLTLTLEFADLPDDAYRLTLRSGDGQFEDPLGHDLDGEPDAATTVPSGDGTPGGDFVIHFTADAATRPFPVPLRAQHPLGGLIYDGRAAAVIGTPTDVDSFTIDLDDGQTVTVVVDPDATLRPTVELLDPVGTSIGTAAAGAAGEDAVLQAVPTTGAGTYTISTGGAAGSIGVYTARLILNAAVEQEEHAGPPNNDPALAEDLDASFIGLDGDGAERGAVLGTVDSSEDWYRFTLRDGQRAAAAVAGLPPGLGTLELYDGDSALVAAAVSAANAEGVINHFVDTTTNGLPDHYFLRVTAGSTFDYSLAVMRDVDFEVEPNGGLPPNAQDLTSSGVVLGHLGLSEGETVIDQQRLTASDATRWDGFGSGVTISGETAIVGAPQADGPGGRTGAAYVYQLQRGQWVEVQKLTASDALPGYCFGTSVAIDGETLIVGARYDDNHPGSAYVFRFDGSRWHQQQKLTASEKYLGDWFGYCVAIDGDRLVVGAPYTGDLDGVAYVFHFDGSQWQKQQTLTSNRPWEGAFGYSVALDGDTVIVGEPSSPGGFFYYGAAHVFHFDGGQWQRQQRLTASDGHRSDQFGASVAIEGDTAIVGTWRAEAAYVFRFDGHQWHEQQILRASAEAFGATASLSGQAAIVGAYEGRYPSYYGEAYVYLFNGHRWVEVEKLTDSPTRYWNGFFGSSVCVAGNAAIIGAPSSGSGELPRGSAHIYLLAQDNYTVSVQAGDPLVIATATPVDGPGEPGNRLDPVVELYDPGGTLLDRDDNGGPDGRNALLTHTAAVTGTYTARVLAAGEIGDGEYVLNVSGYSGAPPAFEVSATAPADAGRVASPPGQMTVDFSDFVRLSSLDASDLTVDGLPAPGVTILDGDTAVFDLPPLAEGVHQVAIAGGAIRDVQDRPMEPFAAQFTIDLTPPRVIASSVCEGDVVADGRLIYTARFDEGLDATHLERGDVDLVGWSSGRHRPKVFRYDPDSSTLTMEFPQLPDDIYTLRLLAGDGRFEDLVGWDLDGEPDPAGTVPSGDGAPGGDFVVHFIAQTDQTPDLARLEAKGPRGSLIYDSSLRAWIRSSQQTDQFTIELDAPQTITVVADPDGALQPTITLLDPDGTAIGNATAEAAGRDAVLSTAPVAAPGTYTIAVASVSETTGTYKVRAILGAAVEAEGHDGPTNDSAASAQDLDAGFFTLGDGPAEHGAVLGRLTSPVRVVDSESFGSGILDGQWTTFSDPGGRIRLAWDWGAADEPPALLMDLDRYADPVPALNEAIWTVDLSGVSSAKMSFYHRDYGDREHPFAGPFTDHYNADGVAISNDGVNWYPAFDAPNQPRYVWQRHTIDLSAAAAAAGLTFGPDFKIKFQQYDDNTIAFRGRGYDAIVITAASKPDDDWYRFTLLDGQTATLALTTPSPRDATLDLYDGSQQLLATGVAAKNVAWGISNFQDLTSDGTADTYFVRTAGSLPTDYSLVLTRDVDFDTESNDNPEAARELPSTGMASGYLAAPPPSRSQAVKSAQDVSVAGATRSGAPGESKPGASQAQPPATPMQDSRTGPEYVPGRLIVRFADTQEDAAGAKFIEAKGGKLIRRLPLIHAAVVELAVLPGDGAKADVLRAAAEWSAEAAVLYAEPDYLVHTSDTTPNDLRFQELWGLHNKGQTGGTNDADIDAPEAWDTCTGSRGVVVASIDSGVDYYHEDLAANMWVNPGEIPADGIDNDGNGYVDDVYGIDTYNQDTDPMDDSFGHGTHTAGTIGAVGNNHLGVTGVSWDVKIMALKFLDAYGYGSTSGAIACLDYITMMKTSYGINVVASNNSWGGGDYSQALKDAIEASNDAGILFVASAGNNWENIDHHPIYPASFDLDGMITVTATTQGDWIIFYANVGVESVDLAAPGVDILSTVPGNQYELHSGTSMAAPHVTGAVALLKAFHPEATPAEVKAAILGGVDRLPGLEGGTVSGGRLNLTGALAALSSPGDYYRMEVVAGDTLVIGTSTPGDGPGQFENRLDPEIELYDPSGQWVAGDDNSAADGRNARLTHVAQTDGTYVVRVVSGGPPPGQYDGEYVLQAGGNSGGPTPFRVEATDLIGGEILPAGPPRITIEFSDSMLLSTLDAADLLVDVLHGEGVPAVTVTVVDGHTAVFELPAGLVEGMHHASITAGAILDLQGTPIEPFAATFRIDTTGPRVIESSVLEGALLHAGPLIYTVRFDEPLNADNLSLFDFSDPYAIRDFSLYHHNDDHYEFLQGFTYDLETSTLTLEYRFLYGSDYTLTLRSSGEAFTDLAGNHLDGELDPVATVPSGDGAAGGDFVLHFSGSYNAVAGRYVFYNNSTFDGHDPAADERDDEAIATDKRALLPTQTATFANYTGYSRGINGIMVDIGGLPGLPGVPTAADFQFKVGNDNDPGGWEDAPQPASVTVRLGEDSYDRIDRITIIWDDNAIEKQWLQVTVLPTANTGLAQPDVFYFGNAIGESGNSATDAKVNAIDVLGARDNQRSLLNPAPIDFPLDFDRNARVNAVDMLIARNNTTHVLNALRLITVPPGKADPQDARGIRGEPAHDAVLRRAADGSGRQNAPLAKLDWLYEFEPMTARRQGAAQHGPPSETVHKLLAVD